MAFGLRVCRSLRIIIIIIIIIIICLFVNDDNIAWQGQEVHYKHDSVASGNQRRKESPERPFLICSDQCPLLP